MDPVTGDSSYAVTPSAVAVTVISPLLGAFTWTVMDELSRKSLHVPPPLDTTLNTPAQLLAVTVIFTVLPGATVPPPDTLNDPAASVVNADPIHSSITKIGTPIFAFVFLNIRYSPVYNIGFTPII